MPRRSPGTIRRNLPPRRRWPHQGHARLSGPAHAALIRVERRLGLDRDDSLDFLRVWRQVSLHPERWIGIPDDFVFEPLDDPIIVRDTIESLMQHLPRWAGREVRAIVGADDDRLIRHRLMHTHGIGCWWRDQQIWLT